MKQDTHISIEETERQKAFLSAIDREWTTTFVADNGHRPRYFLETYGCQMNERDSLHLKGMMEEAGWEEAETAAEANFILYNTCCVREHAEKRVFGNVGALNKRKLEETTLLIAVCGCMMQQQETAERLYQRFPFVDMVFGTHALYRFPELFYQVLMQKTRVKDTEDAYGQIAEDMPTKDNKSVSNFVTIMYGCNNFCTYCIVPYVRGRERSRTASDIINEIKGMVANNCREIMLLGQNVNSYGQDLEEDIDFAQLLRQVNDIEGLERIRFMSSHPKDLSDELILAMAECSKVCNHFHLPVQSGSNRILDKMNRRYTVEDYLNRVEKLREAIPNIELTTDIIVGFPGETEEDFEQTLALIDKVGYTTAYTYMYSSRNGTRAAEWEDQLSEDVKKERLWRLNELQAKKSRAINDRYMNTTQFILVEGVNKKENKKNIGKDVAYGKTTTYKTVYFSGDESMIGQAVPVRITGARLNTLSGERV